MSSDGMDPGSVWQGPPVSQKKSVQQQVQSAEDEDAFAADAQQQLADENLYSDDDEDVGPVEDDDLQQSPPTSEGRFKLLGQRTMPIIVPLVFGGLTSLFTLPLIAEKRAITPPGNIWLVVAFILIVTIAQIIALFYADTNNSLWVMATVGGFFAFLLLGTFAIFGPATGLVLLIALVVLAGVMVRYYFRPVSEGFVDVAYAFGKYSRTLYAGPNVLLPWEKKVYHLKVKEVQWLCPMQRIQLSHDYDIMLRATIAYQLHPEDAHLAVTQADNWESNLRELLITTLQTISTTFSPDDFVSWPQGLQTPSTDSESAKSLARRESINNYLYQQVRDKVALWGVMVHWVKIRDVMLAPRHANIQPESMLSTPATSFDPDEPTQARITLPTPQKVPSGSAGGASALKESKSEQETPPSTPPSAPASPKLPSEEVLVKLYREVQNGKITDPGTIREIAASFMTVADDPEASQAVSFDAARAAANLYEQAEKYEQAKKVK
jgi:hypothetical protein